MDLTKEEFNLLVLFYFKGYGTLDPPTKQPSLINPNLIKLIELKLITEDKRIGNGGLRYIVRKTPLIIEFMHQFSIVDKVMSCINQNLLAEACREILFKVTLADLPILLAHENELIRKVAKQRFDKLSQLPTKNGLGS